MLRLIPLLLLTSCAGPGGTFYAAENYQCPEELIKANQQSLSENTELLRRLWQLQEK